MLQFSYIQEVDFSRGVDQSNVASAIAQGFCEDILNMDIVGAALQKRGGFEKFAGDVPVTVQSIRVAAGVAALTLPATIDLDAVSEDSPLWIYGRMYYGSSYLDIDFHAESFTSLSTYTLSAGSGTLNLVLKDDLGISSHKTLIQATDSVSGEVILLEEFTVDPATGDFDVDYGVPVDTTVRFVTKSCTDTYSSADYVDGMSGELSMDALETITAATHGLSNQLIPMFWQMNSANKYKSVLPESFKIAASGDVEISFEPDAPGIYYQVFLTACADYVEGTAASGETTTTQVISGAESPYLVAACYTEDGLTGDFYLVLPESITYDEVNNQHSVTFRHSGTGEFTNYKVVYAYGSVAANRMQISDFKDSTGTTVNTSGLDAPYSSLAVTGLNNELLENPPHVNFIDKYQDAGETVIAAGGNLFRSYDPEIAESYDGRVRLSSDVVVGPTFRSSNDGRTLGSVVCASTTAAGYLQVISVTHVTGESFTALISAPSHSVETALGAPTTIGAVVSTSYSRLTIAGSMRARLNGNHEITAVSTPDADTISLTITISGAGARDADPESGARAAIFSDTLDFQTDALFAADDVLTLSPTMDVEVISVDGVVTTRAYIHSAEESIALYAGQRLGATASKTSLVVTEDTVLVAGDIVEVAGITTRITGVVHGISSSEITFRDAVTVSDGRVSLVCPYRWQLILPPDTFLGTAPVSETDLLRSVAGKGSLFISSGVKYDGNKVYTSGLPNLQIHSAVNLEEGGGVAVTTSEVTVSSISANTVVVPAADIGNLVLGDKVCLRDTTGGVTTCETKKGYTVTKIDTATNTITFDKSLPASVGGHTYTLNTFVTYRYYLRLSLLDRNGNLVVSASLGSQDIAVRLTKSATIHLSGNVLNSAVDPIDYSNLTVEIFRRRETQTDIYDYYKISSVQMSDKSGYFLYSDTVPDLAAETKSALDEVRDPIPGGIGSTRGRLPRGAGFLTAINNQLVAGSYQGENKATVKVSGSVAYSALQTKEFVVETYSGGETDFYICESSDKQSISAVSSVEDTSFTISVPSAAGITAGDVILVTRGSNSGLNYKPTFIGWWTVTSVNTVPTPDTITINWSGAPANGSITAAETADLVVYHKAGKVPLAHLLEYAPMSGSVEHDETIGAGLSLHLSQAITRIFSANPVYAFGGKDQRDYTVTITGDDLVDVTVPSVSGVSIFCNGRLGTTTALAARQGFLSRVALSVKGYPEVFDGLEEASANDLPQVQDVNPDDGEPVVMALPFFASAAFGSAQQSSALIMFKNHSAYLMDAQAKYVGSTNYFQGIDTSGYGTESPLSVINSQLGVFFANSTGIYLIDRSFKFVRIGTYLSDYFTDGVIDASSLCAVNDISGEKLIFTSSTSSVVFHFPEREGDTVGWTRYDAVPAVMWAHRGNDAIFATNEGYVGSFGSARYADCGEAISTSILFRTVDAGFPTVKKVCRHISVLLSSTYTYEPGDIEVSVATDLSGVFEDCDTFKLTGKENTVVDGLSDLIRPELQQTAFSPATPKAGRYQVKLTSSKADADLTIAALLYQIALIRTRADIQAAETK